MAKGYSKPRGRRIPETATPLRHGRDSRDLEDLARIPVPLTRAERGQAQAAAALVRRHARDDGDARLLLDVLGLAEATRG
jgi:hypothetical protein